MVYPIDNLPPINPGEFLSDELEALGASAPKLAKHLHGPTETITEMMNGERAITALAKSPKYI